jgi:hypothetical protein
MRLFLLIPAVAGFLAAQDNAELLNRIAAMENRIKALEAEVQTLKAQPAALPAAAPPAVAAQQPVPPEQPVQGPVTAPQLGGAGAAAAKVLNPDIAVIGDFLGAAGYPGNRPTPSLEMHESEVAFQEVIDPYARADFFLSFSEQAVELEEGYMTFTALPAGLQVRVGKMRAAFGKVNTLHNHVLPWTDRPLVSQDIVGGEDGIDDAGLSLARILPAPKGIFLEGTAQIFRGDSGTVFRAQHRDDVSTVEHLRAYHDFSDSTNLDLGGSYTRGHSPYGDGANQLWGIDSTLRWKPLQRSIYKSFVGRGEFIWARTKVANTHVKPFGFYVSGDYQFARRWFAGARFDRSQRGACLLTYPATLPTCPSFEFNTGLVQDTGGSLVLTYWPSEFSQIRGQLRHTHYGEGFTANELLFQFQFSIGAHGAHPF